MHGETVALVVAAGRGKRFGGATPKVYVPLAGQPVLRHALVALATHPRIDRVVAVVHEDDRAAYEQAAAGLDLAPPVTGGATRQESVLRGLESLAGRAPDHVLVHDGARPLLPSGLIDRVVAALDAGAIGVLPALPVTDTLKRVDGRHVAGDVDRSGLHRVQTPQGFAFGALLEAHRAKRGSELTDDGAVLQAAGLPVTVVEGSEANIKVTTMSDIERARALRGADLLPAVGTGFDVHRFGPGDHVWLCGVRVPHDSSLVGHSDADVGLHALTDAILGALAMGDIGQHFPPSDERWRGADSAVFLRHAADLARQAGGRIHHVDVTLICERPKIGPHRDAMRARIADLLGMAPARVGLKATTTEGLGFTGRAEGIAAQAAATVLLPA
ncbi:bifunctional 2-C-methyl-D-erythritol 4-phosphate cytidylyltransferase/2-C-methyl-D-erythritol 2,4-cyclodiphosphate synthase [Marinivivus vitaminiproducens]|uniref:bifunctional 2-C-methyl-D-erythritol 4-phosphate cytidylyltransferase/2-C-methyl-D-erythritol 2,4-cyclodiphosphate synthase n=1 Tax=Marinivivus vitaminiproducens TaxID=3035935 RepID=UPI00279AF520|nr:bifunctional 2-C-methyl-D-erythritol 4-phosphate cytidylyltransferase/2-C-methyl-D-erythritol 2,4-cyclodiphosphate synthase [Geminicoccaceae bacterium SCSIO 64248]